MHLQRVRSCVSLLVFCTFSQKHTTKPRVSSESFIAMEITVASCDASSKDNKAVELLLLLQSLQCVGKLSAQPFATPDSHPLY